MRLVLRFKIPRRWFSMWCILPHNPPLRNISVHISVNFAPPKTSVTVPLKCRCGAQDIENCGGNCFLNAIYSVRSQQIPLDVEKPEGNQWGFVGHKYPNNAPLSQPPARPARRKPHHVSCTIWKGEKESTRSTVGGLGGTLPEDGCGRCACKSGWSRCSSAPAFPG